MKVNGYEIKPFAYLKDAYLKGVDLRDANLEGANVTNTILDKQEDQDVMSMLKSNT